MAMCLWSASFLELAKSMSPALRSAKPTVPSCKRSTRIVPGTPICAGQYGYAYVQDFATILNKPATDNNHAFFAQDAWTVGHGLTLNLGLRIEKEDLPVPPGVVPNGYSVSGARFTSRGATRSSRGWERAWGSRNGKLKIFGSYGVVNDVMKLLLAQTSWGAQTYNRCVYPLGPDASGGFNTADLNAGLRERPRLPKWRAHYRSQFAGRPGPAILD